MTEERVTPLRQRMTEDMNIRGLAEKTQKAHIRKVKHFAAFLGRSPDTATPDELRSYQLKMTEDDTSASTGLSTRAEPRFAPTVTQRPASKNLQDSRPFLYRWQNAIHVEKQFSDRGYVKSVGFVVRRGLGSLRSQAMLLHDGVRG